MIASAVLTAAGLWPGALSAAGTTVQVDPARATGADTATVTVRAASVAAPGLGAFTVDVGYDAAAVRATSCEAEAGFFCNADYTDARTGAIAVRCGGFDAMGRTGDVALCRIAFESIGTSSNNCSTLVLAVRELADVDGTPIVSSTANGRFCNGADDAADGAGGALQDGALSSGGAPGAVDPGNGSPRAMTAPGAAPNSDAPAVADSDAPEARGDSAVSAAVGGSGDGSPADGAADAASVAPAARAGDAGLAPAGRSGETPAAAGAEADEARGMSGRDWTAAGGVALGGLALAAAAAGWAWRRARASA